LKDLILEVGKDPGAADRKLEQLEKFLEKKAEAREKQLEKKQEQVERKLEKALEKLEKDHPSKQDKPGKGKSGK
jgi:predicted ATP-grasp superfamily ATP-dependent carboligase